MHTPFGQVIQTKLYAFFNILHYYVGSDVEQYAHIPSFPKNIVLIHSLHTKSLPSLLGAHFEHPVGQS